MQVLCLDVELLVDVAVVLAVLVVFGLVGLLPALLLSRFFFRTQHKSSVFGESKQSPMCRTSFSASASRSVAFRCLKHKYSIRLEH